MKRHALALVLALTSFGLLPGCRGGGGGAATPAQTQPPQSDATPAGNPTASAATSAHAGTVSFQPAPDAEHPNAADPLVAKADGTGLLFDWKWRINGTEIPGAIGDSLSPGAYKKGDAVEVEVLPRDAAGTRGDPRRAKVTIRNTRPRIASSPTSLNGYRVQVTDPDAGETHTFSIEGTPPAGIQLSAEGVVTQDANIKPKAGDKLVIVVKDAAGGLDKQTIEVK